MSCSKAVWSVLSDRRAYITVSSLLSAFFLSPSSLFLLCSLSSPSLQAAGVIITPRPALPPAAFVPFSLPPSNPPSLSLLSHLLFSLLSHLPLCLSRTLSPSFSLTSRSLSSLSSPTSLSPLTSLSPSLALFSPLPLPPSLSFARSRSRAATPPTQPAGGRGEG